MSTQIQRTEAAAVRLVLASALCGAALALGPVQAADAPAQGHEMHDHPAHDHSQHAAGAPAPAPAAEDHSGHDEMQHSVGAPDSEGHDEHQGHDQAAGDADPHAAHRAMMQQTAYQRSEHPYVLPDLKLLGMDGTPTTLLTELNCGKPVMVNFIFTTCTTICPVMSGIFAQVQNELGPERDDVRMISVSIDPEYDTPERLREYAKRFRAGPDWHFLTGDLDDVIAVQMALDVYRGNKMSHEPTTLLRRSEADPWVRLDGIASASEIAAEYRRLRAQ